MHSESRSGPVLRLRRSHSAALAYFPTFINPVLNCFGAEVQFQPFFFFSFPSPLLVCTPPPAPQSPAGRSSAAASRVESDFITRAGIQFMFKNDCFQNEGGLPESRSRKLSSLYKVSLAASFSSGTPFTSQLLLSRHVVMYVRGDSIEVSKARAGGIISVVINSHNIDF